MYRTPDALPWVQPRLVFDGAPPVGRLPWLEDPMTFDDDLDDLAGWLRALYPADAEHEDGFGRGPAAPSEHEPVDDVNDLLAGLLRR